MKLGFLLFLLLLNSGSDVDVLSLIIREILEKLIDHLYLLVETVLTKVCFKLPAAEFS